MQSLSVSMFTVRRCRVKHREINYRTCVCVCVTFELYKYICHANGVNNTIIGEGVFFLGLIYFCMGQESPETLLCLRVRRSGSTTLKLNLQNAINGEAAEGGGGRGGVFEVSAVFRCPPIKRKLYIRQRRCRPIRKELLGGADKVGLSVIAKPQITSSRDPGKKKKRRPPQLNCGALERNSGVCCAPS